VNETTEQRAEFTEQIENRFNVAIREFQDLELEQMRKGEIKVRAQLASVKKSFDIRRTAMQDQLADATKASSAAWSDAKQGLESAWEELSNALGEARAEFVDAEEEESQPS
jgi:hypothetical protein